MERKVTGYNCSPDSGWRKYGRLVVNFHRREVTSIYFDGRPLWKAGHPEAGCEWCGALLGNPGNLFCSPECAEAERGVQEPDCEPESWRYVDDAIEAWEERLAH